MRTAKKLRQRQISGYGRVRRTYDCTRKAVIALRILYLGQIDLRVTPGMTHIRYYLALNIHSEHAKTPETRRTYNETPVASTASEWKWGTADMARTHQTT